MRCPNVCGLSNSSLIKLQLASSENGRIQEIREAEKRELEQEDTGKLLLWNLKTTLVCSPVSSLQPSLSVHPSSRDNGQGPDTWHSSLPLLCRIIIYVFTHLFSQTLDSILSGVIFYSSFCPQYLVLGSYTAVRHWVFGWVNKWPNCCSLTFGVFPLVCLTI